MKTFHFDVYISEFRRPKNPLCYFYYVLSIDRELPNSVERAKERDAAVSKDIAPLSTMTFRRHWLFSPWTICNKYLENGKKLESVWSVVAKKKKKKNIAFENLQTTSRLYIVRALNDSTLDVFLLLFVFSIYVCIYKHNWFATTLATCVLPVSIRLSISECKRSYTEARRQLKTSTALFLVVRTNLSYLASNIWNGREDAYRSYEIRIYRQ